MPEIAVQSRYYQDMCQGLASIRRNLLPDTTNITNIIETDIGYCVYLSLSGQGCIKIRVQVVDVTHYMGILLSVSKPDFITYRRLVVGLKMNSPAFS